MFFLCDCKRIYDATISYLENNCIRQDLVSEKFWIIVLSQ